MGVFDFLFPKRCVHCGRFGDYLCTTCMTYVSFDVRHICLVCNRQTFSSLTHPYCKGQYVIDGAFASVVYNRPIKRLVYQFKYKPNLSDLASFLTDLCFEGIIQQEAFHQIDKAGAVLCPIPLHNARGRERGYNQAQLLARGLSAKLDWPARELLIRTKKTAKQHELTREKRRENLKGAFALKSSLQNSPRTVFLVDDVLTSGATLLEAASVLKHNKVRSVYGLTLAHGN